MLSSRAQKRRLLNILVLLFDLTRFKSYLYGQELLKKKTVTRKTERRTKFYPCVEVGIRMDGIRMTYTGIP